MSEKPKTTTQTLLAIDNPAHRQPSDKELVWERNTLQPTLEKSPERQTEFITIFGHPIDRFYTEADLRDWDSARDLGLLGEPLYTRGIHAMMHRGRFWTMRQF